MICSFCFFVVYKDGEVCIFIFYEFGEDKYGYEKVLERWFLIYIVEIILISVIFMILEFNDEFLVNVDVVVSIIFLFV